MPFETTSMRCPVDYDAFLTRIFGDYMTLPPESEREVHNKGGIVDLEKVVFVLREEIQRKMH